MNFELLSFGDLGLIKAGMSRDRVRTILGENFEEFFKVEDSIVPTDAYDDLGLHVYYLENHNIEGVEFLKWSNFFWGSQRLVGVGSHEVQSFLERAGEVLEFNSSGYYLNRLGLRFYVPDIREDDALVEAVYVVFSDEQPI
ncbi:hypothetical protein ACYZT3_20965 [Pseudomonas sp. MDT1-16]|uniref:hypothetical protein n=1 Tax=Pseudomonas sp. AL03 TaxID=3042230 RepID=UPI00249CC988|nr:hypothetical protein [Pseudomonas sp. AL03]MDI3272673.1 hypothetical protein [Pseudomonas sp. AL03]